MYEIFLPVGRIATYVGDAERYFGMVNYRILIVTNHAHSRCLLADLLSLHLLIAHLFLDDPTVKKIGMVCYANGFTSFTKKISSATKSTCNI